MSHRFDANQAIAATAIMPAAITMGSSMVVS
jgi:hypothetical protein